MPTNNDDTNVDILKKDFVEVKDHPRSQILGELTKGVQTRSQIEYIANSAFISQIEPKKIDEAILDDFWMLSMQEELNQFVRKKSWGSHSSTTKSLCHWYKMGLPQQTQ